VSAELEDSYGTHLAAMRGEAAAARAAIDDGIRRLEELAGPQPLRSAGPGSDWDDDRPPYAPAPNPYAQHALIPDVPLVPRSTDDGGLTLDGDGIPLWHD
jgi:hypothetical protein